MPVALSATRRQRGKLDVSQSTAIIGVGAVDADARERVMLSDQDLRDHPLV
jgi:hypothetical protein